MISRYVYDIIDYYAAVVWQLMRAYTLSVLQKLAGSAKPIEDKEIIEWANKTVSYNYLMVLICIILLLIVGSWSEGFSYIIIQGSINTDKYPSH